VIGGAEFSNLGIKGVIVESATINAHPKLLVGGVWCICDIDYSHFDDARVVPWQLGSLKPIQLSNFDFDSYTTSRRDFTTDEWIDLLIQSIGFNPALFGRRAKLIQLVRLIPFVERNYNLVELGPKGTGKSCGGGWRSTNLYRICNRRAATNSKRRRATKRSLGGVCAGQRLFFAVVRRC